MFKQMSPFLDTLPSEASLALRAKLHERVVSRRATLFEQGEKPSLMFLVREGWAKVVASSPCGRDTIIEMLMPGDFCGATCGLVADRYPASAIMVTEGRVACIARDDFLQLANSHPDLLLEGLAVCQGKRDQQQEMLTSLALETVRQRTCRMLLEIASRLGRRADVGVVFTMPFDRREFSELVGSTLETTIRSLSELRREGLYRQDGDTVTLPAPEALARKTGPASFCRDCRASRLAAVDSSRAVPVSATA